MSWLGKLVGGAFGFALGGPLGAIVGVGAGHSVDRGLGRGRRYGRGDRPGRHGAAEQQRVQHAFFVATFSVMGRLAKSDGRVSQAEIAVAKRVMDRLRVPLAMRGQAQELFRRGKSATFPLEQVIERFADACGRRRDLARLFVEIQVEAACADGVMTAAERSIIARLCARLGITASELAQIESLVRGHGTPGEGPALRAAYAALGVSASADDGVVTHAYRKLVSRHHPDRLVAQGLPEEMVRLANQRTREIRAAYETVRAARAA